MAGKQTISDRLLSLFAGTGRPMYAIDESSRIVYCNRALSEWIGLEAKRVVGRVVEFHSEPSVDDKTNKEPPLTDLCPPPRAISGMPCTGTISCMAPGGRLAHRRAEFIPLAPTSAVSKQRGRATVAARFPVLVLLAEADMSAQDVSAELTDDSTADELHRTIRRFRRAQARKYSIASILGSSRSMQKVRSQIAAAIASGANTHICGPPGSGRGHVAKAIHYGSSSGEGDRLLPIDCRLMTDELLRRVLYPADAKPAHDEQQVTLLLENVEYLSPAQQSLIARLIKERTFYGRVIATSNAATQSSAPNGLVSGRDNNKSGEPAEEIQVMVGVADSELVDLLSTITIRLPRLIDRLEDLPILSQCFLEECNQGSVKQVGSIRSEAVDMLALYSWPGEIEQLREVISSAHRASSSHEIKVMDLPPVISHASEAASRGPKKAEPIVLDILLATLEKELIVRALEQSRGNKSEAASLLGITRPRLYRRLVQLGMIQESSEPSEELPEFIEREPAE